VGRPLDHAHDAGGDVAGLRRVFRALRALALPPRVTPKSDEGGTLPPTP
jgi:hypothetical protein